MKTKELTTRLQSGDRRALSRCISLVENDVPEAASILQQIETGEAAHVIGITGPPGAGKSTLVNALIDFWIRNRKGIRIAVLAIDPTSPFTHGSLLGDRLRMSEHFNNPDVFIRSLATRGALGGLSAATIEITDLLKAAGFDIILIETVGVGQSEVDIARLADTTIVVFVPESGDEIQTIKSGIMEIADIFVINKSDREGADRMVKNLHVTLHDRKFSEWSVPVAKTTASSKEGMKELTDHIALHAKFRSSNIDYKDLRFEKALKLVQNAIFRKLDTNHFKAALESASAGPHFNVYRFVSEYYNSLKS